MKGAHLWHHCLKLQSFPKKSQNNCQQLVLPHHQGFVHNCHYSVPQLGFVSPHSSYGVFNPTLILSSLNNQDSSFQVGAHGANPLRQLLGRGPHGPPRLAGRGCAERLTRQVGGESPAPQPPPPPASSTHSSQIFLPSYVFVSVREKGEKGCFAVRNLVGN